MLAGLRFGFKPELILQSQGLVARYAAIGKWGFVCRTRTGFLAASGLAHHDGVAWTKVANEVQDRARRVRLGVGLELFGFRARSAAPNPVKGLRLVTD